MDIVQLFAQFLEQQIATKAVVGSYTVGNANGTQMMNQPNGLWTIPGMDNVVVSTHIAPQGLGPRLPVFADTEDDPRFGFLFGFSDDQGDEPVNPCDDAPSGYMKMGTITAAWGRVARETDTIEIDSTLHTQRGAPINLQLMNEFLSNGSIVNPQPTRSALDTVVEAQMGMVGVLLERKLAKLLWRGNVANNTSGGGYKEFPGLDMQIATGHVDAETGVAIPSADSYIDDYNYVGIDDNGGNIVRRVSFMHYFLSDLAERTNMNPMTFVLVMRPQLFFELTAVWACLYLTDRCRNDAGAAVVTINDAASVNMRDEMRRGKYLWINGYQVEVVTDDAIIEKTRADNVNIASGSYASNIYMIPLRARGRMPVTYWQYIDYTRVRAQLAGLSAQGLTKPPFWTDGGRLLWVYIENGFCFKLQAKIEPRVVLRTPHLAGKIQNIEYAPLRHLRDFDPESPYWVNGGISVGFPATVGEAVWR